MLMEEFWKRIEESMERMYDRGFEAGVNAQRLSDHEAQNHRLEDMLHRGKKIGFDEGWKDGYEKGYKCGYSEGEADFAASNGIIELDDLDAEPQTVFEGVAE